MKLKVAKKHNEGGVKKSILSWNLPVEGVHEVTIIILGGGKGKAITVQDVCSLNECHATNNLPKDK